MDLYVLDASLRRTELVDDFESLIWTERYADVGDFQLSIYAERSSRALLTVGTRLAIQSSNRVMTIETIEDKVDSNGIAILAISGRSIEASLDDRSNRYAGYGTASTLWTITDTPGNVARTIFDTLCRDNTVFPADNFPFLASGSLLPDGNIPEPTDVIAFNVEVDTVLSTIKKICAQYLLGFRMLRNGDTSELYFDIYTGNDHTTLQTVLPAVVFSPQLDNLSNTKELTSMAIFKNVALVYGANGSEIVYGLDVDPSTAGFERKAIVIKADDITLPVGSDLTAALVQRGQEALAEHRGILAFDGEIPQVGSYIYGLDYGLGDLLEARNRDGVTTNMLVTEQIFVSDKEGDRSYPTLAVDLVIAPGTWYGWDASQVWDDAPGVWADA